MKKTILMLITIMICAIMNAQIGTHIPEERLPQTEPAWWNENESVLPWQNAGCLDSIRANGGMIIDKFIDVSLLNQQSLSQSIADSLSSEENSNVSLLFYFPPGEYEFDETITINRDNVVFRGAGSDKTTFLFTKEWYKCSAWEDLTGNGQYEWIIQGYERNDDLFKVTGNYIGLENLKIENQLDPILITVDLGYEEEGYNGNFVSFSGSNNSWIAGVHMKKSRGIMLK